MKLLNLVKMDALAKAIFFSKPGQIFLLGEQRWRQFCSCNRFHKVHSFLAQRVADHHGSLSETLPDRVTEFLDSLDSFSFTLSDCSLSF